MADATIEIILKVQDEMTKRLEQVEKSVTGLGKQIETQSKKMNESFNGTVKELLALGNVAQGFDNILSTATNTIIRLENAQDRLLNSQDRLEDAQIKINRLIRDGKEGTDEYADAQRDQERATRNLAISENNFNRIQSQLVGTYINLGIQSLQIIQALPQLASLYDKMSKVAKSWGVAESFLLALKGPLGIALVAGAVVVAAYAASQIYAADSTDALSNSQSTFASQTYNSVDAINSQVSSLTGLSDKMRELIDGPMEGELELNKRIAEQTLKATQAKGTEYEKFEQVKLNSLRRDKEIFDDKRGILSAEANLEVQTAEIAKGAQVKSFEERLQAIHNFSVEAMNEMQPVRQMQIDIANFEKNQRTYSRGTTQTSQSVKIPTPAVDASKWTVSPNFNNFMSSPTTRDINVTLQLEGKTVARYLNNETKYKMNQ